MIILIFGIYPPFFQSLPFGGVKDSGFGRFAGVEGLRACCLVKSVVEDRWWPFVKTKIPKPIQVSLLFFSLIFHLLLAVKILNLMLALKGSGYQVILCCKFQFSFPLPAAVSYCREWVRVSGITRGSTVWLKHMGPLASFCKRPEALVRSKF